MDVAFDNPPINEVVIAAYFNPPLVEFQSQHVGLFWGQIKDEFSVVQQQLPLGVGGNAPDPDEPFPMPRYWFITEDDVYVVQVQKDAFILNWRRRNNRRYPGFSRDVKLAFDRLYGKFDAFLQREVGAQEISVDLCELSYVDTIVQCDYWRGPGDTRYVFPSFSNLLPSIDDTENFAFDCSYTHPVRNDLAISARLRTMVDTQKSNQSMLVLEMKASTRFGGVPKAETDSWFQEAHDAILKYFMEMTNQEVQRRHWGLRMEDTA